MPASGNTLESAALPAGAAYSGRKPVRLRTVSTGETNEPHRSMTRITPAIAGLNSKRQMGGNPTEIRASILSLLDTCW